MKISRDEKVAPITITLETIAEQEHFKSALKWAIKGIEDCASLAELPPYDKHVLDFVGGTFIRYNMALGGIMPNEG